MAVTEPGGRPAPAIAAQPSTRRTARLQSLVLAPILPLLGFLLFGSAGRDDAYITLWAADQLRTTGRITNYNGRALEQSSSLLHVLTLAGTSWITRLPVTTVAPWSAVLAGAACVPAAYWVCDALDPRGRLIAAALVATLPPLVYWSFGGLETSLAVLVLLVALLLTVKTSEGFSKPGIGLAAVVTGVALIRPEMGLVLLGALLLAALVIRLLVPPEWTGADGGGRSVAIRRVLVIAAGTVAAIVAVALARRILFGAWVPRPVSVKVGSPRIGDGLRYAQNVVTESLAIVAVGVVIVIAVTQRRRLTPGWVTAASVVVSGTIAVVVVGGDWMECGRLLAPYLAVLLVLVGAIVGRLPATPRVAVAAALILLNVAGLANFAARYSTGVPAWSHLVWRGEATSFADGSFGWWETHNAVHVRDIPFIRHADPIFAALTAVVAPRPVVYSSEQAGMVVYYLQQAATRRGTPFHFVDQAGLSDDTLDKCRRGVPARPNGKSVGWARVLKGECGPLPDVISGITTTGPLGVDQVASEYTVVYQESGSIAATPWPNRTEITPAEWIAVRNDLVPRLRSEQQRQLDTATP